MIEMRIDKFKVVGVDTFSHEDWVEGYFDTKEEALAVAKSKGGVMNKMYVYDKDGKRVGNLRHLLK